MVLMKKNIAYLAPELPGLSATFVYNEILALEKKGFTIFPVSIHKPKAIAGNMSDLALRTHNLYSDGILSFIFSFILNVFQRPVSLFKTIGWLLSDIMSAGIFKSSSLKLVYQFLAANKLSCLLLKNKIQHLHIHFAHVATQVGMYASGISGITFSVTSHANDIFERGLLLKTKAERSSCFATISEYNRNFLLSKSVPEEKLKVIRCGINFNVSNMDKYNKNNTFTVGSLGRLVEKKGMSILLEAIKRLNEQDYIVKLEIAGDGPLRGELEEMTHTLGLSDQVKFHGAINHSLVPGWLQTLDAFVLACVEDSNGDKDGIPVSLMEAMSHNIVVVSTKLSGIPELIRHNDTGLLAEAGNPNSLAEQIKTIITNTEMSKQMAKSGNEHVNSEFSEETNIQRLISCFNS